MIIGLYTWLALGKPRSVRLAGVLCLTLTDVQWSLIKRMEHCMMEFDRLTGANASDSSGLSTSLVDRLASLAQSRHEYIGVNSEAACEMTEVGVSPTMCLGADNASLPKIAAQIELKPPVVPPPVSRLLQDPLGFVRAPEDLPEAVPRRHLNIAGWPLLLEKLVQIGLARLVPLSTIPQAHGRALLGG
eukprot:762256-Amphidinium_carterae.1